MSGKTLRGAWLLLGCLALAPGVAFGQLGYAPADPQLPIPLGSTRPEDGGLYAFGNYAMYRTTNPLKSQTVGVSGFVATGNIFPVTGTTTQTRNSLVPAVDANGNLPVLAANQQFLLDGNGVPIRVPVILAGTRTDFLVVQTTQILPVPGSPTPSVAGDVFGDGSERLNVDQLTGQSTYAPGFEAGLGWKFKDGSSVYLSWLYLTQVHYRAGATLVPQTYSSDLSNTFLYANVYNTPPQYAGAPNKIIVDPVVAGGTAPREQAVAGIWNAASIMTIDFLQRTQQWEIVYRQPIYELENYRLNGLVGPRLFWIWERFRWRTTSLSADGTNGGPENVGIYSNVTSNRMYGLHAGCEQEFYIGHGFAVNLKTEGALFLNSVKERAKYETEAKYLGLPENKRAKREFSIVPEAQVSLGLMWYPTEFIQVQFQYELMGFLNTFASRRPIDFDYSNLAPQWSHTSRLYDGFRFGVAFTF